ncbi:MAG TPA: molecular chaperone HtpG [Ignavibacteriaceae bacterium]|nr:MAG: Chaperone protein HtpG [Ignavibacteria bacterium ADurb.Bin266]OQY70513.1 MAG: molecular chaperone HtpG [Ignavibacteriales bacterium UTCHB2]HQF42069.1 molecular chaperone HtpG [Ignavibacteriaceae bacterium]HQI40721.1 molecular chaperone HtpG [Ignavibacteriaceae bacterium]HQJ45882.1 molecular chaperone HtpG [Ignavibacteriaceae bacterium]
MTETTKTKFEFKAETKKLLDILVHSLYTSREIFLRELISNSSDALDKLRFESNKGTDIADKELPLEIRIDFDDKKNLVTITDTGIGMTRDEMIANIGTIAKSGSEEFLKQLAENKEAVNNIIGRFGIGFYSVFMVAKEVVIKTKSFKKDQNAVEWKSDGTGDYEISDLTEEIKRGTTIEVYLKDDAKEFAEKYRLEGVIKKHSNFISFPIYLKDEKVNTIAAIWREPKSSIKKEQYDEFYKFLTYDNEEPLETIHSSVDAPIQFNALLFIPKKSYEFWRFNRDDYGLDLYVRRVLIQHQNKELLPEYLSFVKGVVDSEDLPLNISRETLQENIIFTKISQSITSNVLSHLTKVAKDNPERYADFWKEHGKIFKLGYMDFSNMEKYQSLLRFNSSESKDEKELVSLEDYAGRMKKDQKEIFYALGASREAIDMNPHLEIFKSKGLEVLYLYDPVDEFVVTSIRKYKDFDFKSVDAANLKDIEKLEDVVKDEEPKEKLSKEDDKAFGRLMLKMKEILGDRVTEVHESKRLKGSPATLINPDDSMSSTMQKILKMSNQGLAMPAQKRLMEINKDHKLIINLVSVFKKNENDQFIVDTTEQLYESALLLEGSLDDPHKLVNRLNKMLTEASDLYRKNNE